MVDLLAAWKVESKVDWMVALMAEMRVDRWVVTLVV